MARYEKGHREETRKRLVQLASERFRRDGIDGVGIATIMADAKLTHGGFYAHFASKEALVEEAVTHALAEMPAAKALERPEDNRLKVEDFIDSYLSPYHRDHPEKGCALAFLGPDLARRPRSSRVRFEKEGLKLTARLAEALPGVEDLRVARATMLFAVLVGALQVARLLTSKKASDRVLSDARGVSKGLVAAWAGEHSTL